jgi:F0F1-type ATP synthase membrane subunit a
VTGPRLRGCIYLLVALAVVAALVFLVFVVMPNGGTAVALPVIEVPGETVVYGGFFGMNLTNTIIGTIATDLLIVLMVVLLWRASRGWTKDVPGRLQGSFEVFITTFRNFCDGIGGEKFRKTRSLWYLVATIFFFLLVANYMKLLPGVETVGKMHCAYPGQSGFAMIRGSDTLFGKSYRLWVDEPLNAGTTQTAETEALCHAYYNGAIPENGFAVESAEEIARRNDVFGAVIGQVTGTTEEERTASYADLVASTLSGADESEVLAGRVDIVTGTDYETASSYVLYAEQRLASAEAIAQLQPRVEALEAQLETAEGDEAAAIRTELSEIREDLNVARTQLRYPGATLVFNESQLETNARPYIFHITPFFRGPATDLSFTIGLALLAVIVVQIYGVRAQGPAYFEKFINLSAVGNAGKRPLGLIEIISEIGKIVSLAFRLFGNLFAGGVALMAVTFIISMLVPGVIYGLELIIGGVQALVFAVLTLVFSVQAMESHHGDHDDHHDDHAEQTVQH